MQNNKSGRGTVMNKEAIFSSFVMNTTQGHCTNVKNISITFQMQNMAPCAN